MCVAGLDIARVKSLSRHKFKPPTARSNEENGNSVYFKLFDNLANQDVKRDLQITCAADDKVNRPQCIQSFQLFDGLFMQAHSLDGVPADLCERVQNPHVTKSEEHTSELQSQSNIVCRL